MVNNKWLDSYLRAVRYLKDDYYSMKRDITAGNSFEDRDRIAAKLKENGLLPSDIQDIYAESEDNELYSVPDIIKEMSISIEGEKIKTKNGNEVTLKKFENEDFKPGTYNVRGSFISYIDNNKTWQITVCSSEIINELELRGYKQVTSIRVPLASDTELLNPELEEKRKSLMEVAEHQRSKNYEGIFEVTPESAEVISNSNVIQRVHKQLQEGIDIEEILSSIPNRIEEHNNLKAREQSEKFIPQWEEPSESVNPVKWFDSYLKATDELKYSFYSMKDDMMVDASFVDRNKIAEKLKENGLLTNDIQNIHAEPEYNKIYSVPDTIKDMSIALDRELFETKSGEVIRLVDSGDHPKAGTYNVRGRYISYVDNNEAWYTTIYSDEVLKELRSRGYQEYTRT